MYVCIQFTRLAPACCVKFVMLLCNGGLNRISAEVVIVLFRDSRTSTTQQACDYISGNKTEISKLWNEKEDRSDDLHWLPFDIRKQAHLLFRTSPNNCDLHANGRSVVLYNFTCSAHLLSCGDFNLFGTRRLESGLYVMNFWPQGVQIITGASIWSFL